MTGKKYRTHCVWRLQNASCMKNLISPRVQWGFISFFHAVFKSWRFGGAAGECWSSVRSTDFLLGLSLEIDCFIPTPLFSSRGTSWESSLQYDLDCCPAGSSTWAPSSSSWWMETDSSHEFPSTWLHSLSFWSFGFCQCYEQRYSPTLGCFHLWTSL